MSHIETLKKQKNMKTQNKGDPQTCSVSLVHYSHWSSGPPAGKCDPNKSVTAARPAKNNQKSRKVCRPKSGDPLLRERRPRQIPVQRVRDFSESGMKITKKIHGPLRVPQLKNNNPWGTAVPLIFLFKKS